jgi:hypothetical protein
MVASKLGSWTTGVAIKENENRIHFTKNNLKKKKTNSG